MLRTLVPLVVLWSAASAATLQSPQEFAGFRMGEDKKLLRWDRIVEYMKMASAASPRVRYEEIGKSTNGNPFVLMTISSPENLRDSEKYKAAQRQLAYPRSLSDNQADQIIADQKAVLLITCNIHATEIASSQMVLELVHRLATEDSPFIRKILDNVIFLLVPSFNPDGQIIVTDWYKKNLDTPFERSPLPELYHKYTGHDNNRDAFMNTQAESRLVNRVTYKEWFPVVFLDEHQMGNGGARIFVPPFRDPINPNVDPTVWQLNGLLGYAMGAALHDRGYTGIVNDQTYTSWWQGGFLMQAWWHNMVGLLTEVASVSVASPVEQERAKPGDAPRPPPSREQESQRDPRAPIPAPRDVTPRNTYPRPWLGGRWTLRDIVDYELTATYGLLEAVANNRELLVRSFYRMNRRQIELGAKEAPYAWVVPAAQQDPPVAARLLQILDELGVEVHRAAEAFEAGGEKYEAGSHVILMAQPFRAFAKDLLEKQVYPSGPGAERPYDVTGWTLPMQMGVKAMEVAKPFTAKLEPAAAIRIPRGKFEASGKPAAYLISHQHNNSAIAVNRLLASGAAVGWTPEGDIVVRGDVGSKLQAMSEQIGIDVKGVDAAPQGVRALKKPRIALHQPHSSSMDEGWTRWLLEQYEFPYTSVRSAEIREGKLKQRFDVVVIADSSKDFLIRGVRGEWVHPSVRGGLEKEGVNALREFVREGGTLITLGSASLVPIEEFPLPLKNALRNVRPEQFSSPGSILRVFVDNRSPVGYGMPEQASAVFYNDVAFEMVASFAETSVRSIARYPAGDLLQSGWIHGPEFLHDKIAAAEVTMGKGRVILLGFSVQNRAQPHGTFKLLFNSLHYAGLD